MVSKCANPQCSTPFRYLREGKLFLVETKGRAADSPGGANDSKMLQHYWLCDECSQWLTIRRGHPAEATVSLQPVSMQAAVQSSNKVLDQHYPNGD
jgi:hypothetical protein